MHDREGAIIKCENREWPFYRVSGSTIAHFMSYISLQNRIFGGQKPRKFSGLAGAKQRAARGPTGRGDFCYNSWLRRLHSKPALRALSNCGHFFGVSQKSVPILGMVVFF